MVKPIPKITYYTPAIGWGIFMTTYSLLPQEALPKDLLSLNDKLLHMSIYFFTATLIYLGQLRYNFSNRFVKKQLWYVFVLCLCYGGVIEILQHCLVKNRHGEWLDFLANGVGALIALLFFSRWRAK